MPLPVIQLPDRHLLPYEKDLADRLRDSDRLQSVAVCHQREGGRHPDNGGDPVLNQVIEQQLGKREELLGDNMNSQSSFQAAVQIFSRSVKIKRKLVAEHLVLIDAEHLRKVFDKADHRGMALDDQLGDSRCP